MRKIIVFDMDGVLVDVRPSYRATVIKTIDEYCKEKDIHIHDNNVSPELIDKLKLQSGFNDDWILTHHLLSERGIIVRFDEVKRRFEEIFLGTENFKRLYKEKPRYHFFKEGMIDCEKPIATIDFLRRVAKQAEIALATGRNESEALYTLQKFDFTPFFKTRITMYEIPSDKRKPHPYSLVEVVKRLGNNPAPDQCYYIGDIPDDITAAGRAKEYYPFKSVGLLEATGDPIETRQAMQQAGADFIIDKLEDLLEVL